ncbi:MAG: hypothetical protein ACTHM6_11665, partial [Tepidisphaeraceae bacterium]
PAPGWDLSAWEAVLIRVKNLSDAPVTIGARAENPTAMGLHDTVYNAIDLPAHQQGVLKLRLTRRPEDPTYEPFRPYFMYYNAIAVRDNTVDPAQISKIVVGVEHGSAGQKVVVESATTDGHGVRGPVPFFPFIDEFGQYKHADWPGKIYSDADFAAALAKDKADLAAHAAPTDWDEYGGWERGPKQQKTGYFYPKKVAGKWWLVDPAGNLFWSYGPTGVRVGGEGGPITGRENWFDQLPAKTGDDAAYWTTGKNARFMYYKDKSWDAFSFSARNASRKYGPDWREASADKLHQRLRNWGFNSIGNWSDPVVYLKHKTPYAVAIHPAPLLLNHMPDVFNANYARQVQERLEKEQGTTAGDPWCIGYFVDNELIWGPRPRGGKIVDGVLAAPAATAAKKVLQGDLIKKYKDIAALNNAWQTHYASWNAFMEPSVAPAKPTDAYVQDAGDFGMKFAERYFSTVRDAVKRVAPHQLYLGCRFNGHIDKPLVEMAAKYCDVISYNIYELPKARLNQYRAVVDKPFIVGEFGVGTDPVESPWRDPKHKDESRVQLMRSWLKEGLADPLLVGAHFFQFQDQPIYGRADGEAQLRGFVDVTDTPHFDLVQLNRQIGYKLYEIRSTENFPSQ